MTATTDDVIERIDALERLIRGNQERYAPSMRLLTELVTTLTKTPGEAVDAATFIAFFDTLPIPAWLKRLDADGVLRMAWINGAYERDTGVMATSYVGTDDGKVWDDVTVQAFEENDRAVIETRLILDTAEPADGKVWRGYKWPLIEGDKVVGVFGLALGLPQ